jgi:hypothetical protein
MLLGELFRARRTKCDRVRSKEIPLIEATGLRTMGFYFESGKSLPPAHITWPLLLACLTTWVLIGYAISQLF